MKESVYIDTEHLKKTIKGGVSNKSDAVWISAFDIYNSAHKSIGGIPLSMNCAPCYWKVLKFVLLCIERQENN